MSCIGLDATIDKSAFIKILVAVRAKLLDFTLKLEREVPVSTLITVGRNSEISAVEAATVTQLTQNIFNAPIHNISSSGGSSIINLNVIQGDVGSLEKALIAKGFDQSEAKELASVAASESPEQNRPFGVRAGAWIGKRLSQGADGIFRIGGRVLEDDIASLFQKFYNGMIG